MSRMRTPEIFVVQSGKPYVIQRNGSEVYRIGQNGTLSRLTQEREITGVLLHHTVVTEPEALILAHAKPSHTSAKPSDTGGDNQAKARPEPASRTLVKLKGRLSNQFRNGVKISALKIVVLTTLFVLAIPFIPINWGILIRFLIVVLAVPAVVFPIVFVIVVLASLYLLIDWLLTNL